MKGGGSNGKAAPGASRWRRWVGYALGMVIESAAVGTIALAALGLMFLIKVLVK
ncbi:MAG: hypothetical protein HPY75_09610 [Actinobacteria bacterium]|nr:hypothetical protein [Actinomycetota bacterium]